jgi:hypothetical protein
VVKHPLGQNATSTAHDAGEAALHLGQVLDQKAGVNRLVIDPLLAVLLDDVQEVVFRKPLDRTVHALEGLIYRHRADRHRRSLDDRRTHLIEVDAARGEVHHGVGAVLDGQMQLLQFFVDVAGIGRSADVGVHLALAGDADRHRLEVGMVDVGRDDHPAPRHLLHHQRFGQVFTPCHMGHLLGHNPPAGEVELGDVGSAANRFATLLDPGGAHDG